MNKSKSGQLKSLNHTQSSVPKFGTQVPKFSIYIPKFSIYVPNFRTNISGAQEQWQDTPSRDLSSSPCSEHGSSDNNAPVPHAPLPRYHRNGR